MEKKGAIMPDESQQSQGLHYGWVILFMSVVTVLGCLGFARFGYTMLGSRHQCCFDGLSF